MEFILPWCNISGYSITLGISNVEDNNPFKLHKAKRLYQKWSGEIILSSSQDYITYINAVNSKMVEKI